MKYLIANWKQNKSIGQLDHWVERYVSLLDKHSFDDLTVVICPPFSLIYPLRSKLKRYNFRQIHVGSQDISKYPDGPHTGEIGYNQLDNKFSIIGHSERRRDGETAQDINQKCMVCLDNKITPIICFGNLEEFENLDFSKNKQHVLFAYEPVYAIGTGNPASVESVEDVLLKTGLKKIIYGGSVDKISISNYLNEDFICGFLVGGASLDPQSFAQLTNVVLESV